MTTIPGPASLPTHPRLAGPQSNSRRSRRKVRPNHASLPPGPLQPTVNHALTSKNAVASVTTTTSAKAAAPNVNSGRNGFGNILGIPLSITTRPRKRWDDFWNTTNGIGVTALVLALVFCIGAWVGMNMQYNQGAKSLELTIWTTCADHEVKRLSTSSSMTLATNVVVFIYRASRTQICADRCCRKALISLKSAVAMLSSRAGKS